MCQSLQLCILAVACTVFGNSVVTDPEHRELCFVTGDDDDSLLQMTLRDTVVSKVVVDVDGEAFRVDATTDDEEPEAAEVEKQVGAPYPRTPSGAALTLAQMIKVDTAARAAASSLGWHEWLLRHGPLATTGTTPGEAAVYMPTRKPGLLALLMELISPGGVLLGALTICFVLAQRKRGADARLQAEAQNKAPATVPWGVPTREAQGQFYRRAPRVDRRAFNLGAGTWKEAAPAASTPSPPKPSGHRLRVRARSSTRDGGRREGPQEPQSAQRSATLDAPGDARAIAGFIFSRALQQENPIDALRVVREVLAAAGCEQPPRLEKADLLMRGATPQCFELIRAAGLRDVGRGLVLADASGPRLLRALAAVEAALCAAPSALAPLPSLKARSDSYDAVASYAVVDTWH